MLALGASLTLFNARSSSVACADCDSIFSLTNLAQQWSSSHPMKLPYPAPPSPEDWRQLKPDERLANAKSRLLAPMQAELKKHGIDLGSPAFIRIFKEDRELELWLKAENRWKLFRTYPIAAMSGQLGPKLKEGDGQAPEGFYAVTQKSLNAGSSFHLSFNIGYPNAYDQHHGRTGSFIMVHGHQVSIGCFAITDPVIEELYLIVEAALKGGQNEVPVHVFPFHLTEERLAKTANHSAADFWRELRPGYEAFNSQADLPTISVLNGRYHLK